MNPHSLALEEVNAATQFHRSMTSLYNQRHMPAIGLISPQKQWNWMEQTQPSCGDEEHSRNDSFKSNKPLFLLRFRAICNNYFPSLFLYSYLFKNYLQTISDCEKKYLDF
ncbi:hypothetical protein Bca4012_084221 [Brassica carinata]|uniref:Uncharacterized protein n=1 Tax=Brassica carinata TaxID=52824 RepID=A0A8X7SHX9_BRACI|nr:hypothetical protein Bca52824_026563 [Brassica carinata]